MFEPVHGSAPDIAGQGIADPTAAIMSVALLLSHIGEDDAAARVDKAVEQHLADRRQPLGSVRLVHRFDGVQVGVEAGCELGGSGHVLACGRIRLHRMKCFRAVPLGVIDDTSAVGAEVDVG